MLLALVGCVRPVTLPAARACTQPSFSPGSQLGEVRDAVLAWGAAGGAVLYRATGTAWLARFDRRGKLAEPPRELGPATDDASLALAASGGTFLGCWSGAAQLRCVNVTGAVITPVHLDVGGSSPRLAAVPDGYVLATLAGELVQLQRLDREGRRVGDWLSLQFSDAPPRALVLTATGSRLVLVVRGDDLLRVWNLSRELAVEHHDTFQIAAPGVSDVAVAAVGERLALVWSSPGVVAMLIIVDIGLPGGAKVLDTSGPARGRVRLAGGAGFVAVWQNSDGDTILRAFDDHGAFPGDPLLLQEASQPPVHDLVTADGTVILLVGDRLWWAPC